VRTGRLSIAGVVAVQSSLTWLWKSGSFVWWYLFEGASVGSFPRESPP